MAVRRNVTMSFEALCSCTILHKVKLQPRRCSFICWYLLLLILLPITFMLSQCQFLTQIFPPTETQPANCRNHLTVLTSVLLATPLPYCHFHTFSVPPLFSDFTFKSYTNSTPSSLLWGNVSSVTLLLKIFPIITLLLSLHLVSKFHLAHSSPVFTHLFLIIFFTSLPGSHSWSFCVVSSPSLPSNATTSAL